MKHYFRRLLCGTIGSIVAVVAGFAVWGIFQLLGYLGSLISQLCGWINSKIPDTAVMQKELDPFSVAVGVIACICFSLIAVIVEWIWRKRILKSKRRAAEEVEESEEDERDEE